MNDCEYETVNTEELEEDFDGDDNFSWKYFFRQVMVSSVAWVTFFVYGLGFGAPTIFIPKIRKENKDAIDESMHSWLASIFNFAAVPWTIILPIAATYIGRKYPYAFACIAMLVSSIVLYCSNTVIEIIVAEFLLGIVGAANTTMATMVLGEYTSPKYRGLFVTMKPVSFCWGIWISNAIGTFFHWKNIPLVMIILSVYPIIIMYFWPESPYFLANKSKYEECARSHRWLKGKKSEKELTKLLSPQNLVSEKQGFFKVVLSKRFYKAFLLCLCLFSSYSLSGKLACTMYSIDIIKKMTSSESTAYTGMLILDGVTVFSMYLGSMLSKILRRRVLFISCLSIGILSLFALAAHVYLVQLSVLQENSYITLVLLSIYSISIGCGPVLFSATLFCELTPLQNRSFAVCIVSLIERTLIGVVLKLTPMLIKKFGLHTAFFAFGLLLTICMVPIILYMPETKDKTLFEISDEIQGNNNKNTNPNKGHVNLAELKHMQKF